MSKTLRTSLLVAIAFFFCAFQNAVAQTPDHVKLEYQDLNTIPDKLNVCGDPDEVTVILTPNGSNKELRSNITAVLNLFKGVRFVKLVEAKSTPGVKMLDTSNINKPLFGLPNLTATGEVTQIKITYQIQADCGFLDTLAKNNNLTVFDTWDIKFDLGTTKGLIESEKTAEYRDAFEVPVFSLALLDKFNTPLKADDCISQNVQVTNSGLKGSVTVVTYSVVYGTGVTYKGILVNNQDIPFQKTVLPNGDTLLTVRITGFYFKTNKIGGGPGNGNGSFDPNENLIIKENICIVNCNKPTYSIHTIAWGCFGKECDQKTINSFLPVGVGTPNPIFATTGSVPNQMVGFCQEGITSVKYTNQGTEVDAGFGTMYDVITGIDISGKFQTKVLGYKVNSLSIAGKNIPLTSTTFVDLGKNPIFKTDPDGPGGLEDADKDGYFDDLKIGQFYEMVLKYDYLCAEQKDTFFCTNPRNLSISAVSSYRNACNERLDKINENYLNVSNNNNGFEDVADPDAFIAKNDTFFIHHTEERSMFFFEKSCDGKEEFYAKVFLPKNVVPVINSFGLFKNGNTTPLVMKSNKIKNDTLYLAFDATEPFIGGKFDLQMAFVANAGAKVGPTSFPFEYGFYCPKCDCRSVWYCSPINGPKLHLADACITGVCPKGVRTTSFDVKRRTFGYTDATFKTKFDPAKANKKVAISCDSVEIRINGEVGDLAIANGAIGVGINYTAVNEKDVVVTNKNQILKFGKGKIIINGTTTCDIAGASAKFTSGTDKKLRIDLSDCLKSKNITLNKCDKIQFIGSFQIDPDGPYSVQFKYIPNLRGFIYGVDNGQEISCDDFGDNFIVAKNKTLFDFPTSANFPKGCDKTDMDFKLITVNNGFKDYFGKEYRQAVEPSFIDLKFDPAMLKAFENLDVSYSIPGHPVFGNNQIPLGTLKNAPNGKFSVNFDTVQYRIPAYNNISYYSFLFRISAVPNCRALTGSSKGDNRFDFDATLKYKDRYYAKEIGDGSCSPDSTVSIDNDVFYTEPPTLSYNPLSNPNFDLVGDTAVWTVKVCNTSTTSDAGSTFIAIENPNDKLVVTSIDVIDGNKFTPLTVKKYGVGNKNAFALNKGLKASNGLNPIGDVCSTVRIKAYVKSCGSFQVQSLVGWNCTAPADPNWNPGNHPPCEDLQQTLRVVGQEPMLDALLDEGFNKNPDLCDTVYLDLLVRNTGKANAFDVKTQIWIPALGATLVPGSIEMAYPSGAPFKKIGDPIKGATSTKGIVYTYNDFKNINPFLDKNGLAAYNVASPTDSNEYKIRYRVVTDCEFKSGSLSFFAVQGQKACGETTNLETGESKPIKIKGTILTNNFRLFNMEITDNTLIIPSLISIIELKVTNTTVNPSEPSDLMTITLPKGILYAPNTTKGVQPTGYAPGEPTIKLVGGQQVLTWSIAAGLKKGESAILNFFTTTPDFDCDNAPIFEASIVTIVKRAIACKSNPNSTPCVIDIITSTGGEAFIELPVSSEGALGIDFKKVTSTCVGNGNEKIIIKADLVNLDSIPFPDFPIDITYYYDDNSNGKLDSTEEIIKLITENGPLDIGKSKPVNHEFTAEGKRICKIRAQVNAQGATCANLSFPLKTPELQVGADKDFCAFPGDDIVTNIGDDKCNDLKYNFVWNALDAKYTPFITTNNVINPTIKFKWTNTMPDKIGFYVSIDRGTGCDISYDTIFLSRSTKDTPKAGISILNDKLCAGLTTTLTATGGNKYEWTDLNGLSIGLGATLQIAPKQPTRYFVKVTNASGCKDTTSIFVAPIPTPVVTASPDITICFGTMKQITAKVNGGTNNYSFNWTPALGLNNPILANPVAKPSETTIYKVEAIDANGCKGSDEVRVQVDTCVKCMPPILDLTSVTKAMCGMANGSIKVYPWGGHTDKYIYEWIPNIGKQGGFGEERTDLPAGVYTLKMYLKEDTACNNSFKIVVPNAGSFAEAKIVLGNISNPSCGSSANGYVNFAVIYPNDFDFPADTIITDGTKNYKNGQLPEGQFFINIYNKNKCLTTSQPFSITNTNGDPISIISKITNNCDSLNIKGAIELTINGGTSPFVFKWADLNTSNQPQDRTGLVKGTYSVTVSDAKGCSTTKSSEVKDCKSNKNDVTPKDTTITATVQAVINTKCFGGADGSVNVTLKGDATLIAGTKAVITDVTGTKQFDNGKLSAGDYIYIVYDSKGKPSATATFTIKQPEAIKGSAIATEVCKTTLGTVTTVVTGGTNPYTYTWADLTGASQPANRLGLAKGTYKVSVTDANGCSPAILEAIIAECKDTTGGNGGTPKDTTITATIQSSASTKCFGGADGAVNVTLKGDAALIAGAKAVITDATGTKQFDNGKLSAGDYLYIVYDSKGKPRDTVAFTIKQPAIISGSATATEVCKTTLGTVSTAVTGGTNPYTYTWADLTGASQPANRTGLVKGTYKVSVTDANGCTPAIIETTVGECKDTTGGNNGNTPCTFDAFAGKDVLKVYLPKCDEIATICVPLTTNTVTLKLDGNDYTIKPCIGSFYNVSNLLSSTSISVKNWTVDSKVFTGSVASVNALVDSLNKWDSTGNWVFDAPSKRITGGNANKVYGFLNIQDLTGSNPVSSGLMYIKSANGTSMQLPKGNYTLVAKNDKNCLDTLKINVDCISKTPKPDTIYVSMLIGETKTGCLDITELAGPPVSVKEGGMNQYIADANIEPNFCVKFKGVNLGSDTIFFQSCDAFGICDITYVVLDVNKPFKDIYDTIMIGQNMKQCIHPSDYGIKGAFTVKTTCDQKVDGNITFKVDQALGCIIYDGLKTGSDTICVQVCENASSKCGNFKIFVFVKPNGDVVDPNKEIVYKDTIYVGDKMKYTIPYPATLTPENITNTFINKDKNADFVLDSKKYFVTYEGIKIGADTAYISVCDKNNTNCFKVKMYICVIDPSSLVLPRAKDDHDTTYVGGKLIIDELKNDIIPGKLTNMALLSNPNLGTLKMNSMLKMEYLNTKDECGVVDTFDYFICNADGCDTARVYIYIRCLKVKVHTGFSPNDDKTNDTFVITGIEAFPNSELTIYNRWGNEVMFSKGYKNEWSGTWNGEKVPDGTYFYILDLKDEERTMLSGYLYIRK